MKWIEAIERAVDAGIERAKRLEPRWSRLHPNRLWFPIVVMICFVAVDNFRPADPRGRMAITRFEVHSDFGLSALLFSVAKIHHLSYFFIFGLFLRRLWGRGGFKRSLWLVLALSVLIEFEQAFTSGRHARLYDLIPNVFGLKAAWWYVDFRLKRGRGFAKESAISSTEGPK